MNSTIPAPATPNLLQAANWILDPTGYMQVNSKRYGDIFKASVFGINRRQVYMVSDPKALQFILSHDMGKQFSSPGELNEILASLLGRQSTMLLSGEQHRQRRQLVMPPLHGAHLQEYGEIIQRITQQAIQQWQDGETVNVRTMMQKITMKIILQVVFGLEQSERYAALERLLSLRLDMTATPFSSIILFFPWLQQDLGPWSPGAQISRLAAETDALLFREIAERRSQPNAEQSDVLSLLLAARDSDGRGLSDQDLRDELMTLLVAGHETTATAITSAMYWLHRSDLALQNLQSELDGLKADAAASELLSLPYLTAVCQEALRIHPVAMLTFPRQVEEPVQCCGYPLEPGDLLIGSIYLLHQREDLYHQPREFRPERFIERQYSPYEYMPFGAGVRRCVGASLAQYELRIVLGTMIRQLDLTLLNSRPVPQARRGVTLGHGGAVQLKRLGRRPGRPAP